MSLSCSCGDFDFEPGQVFWMEPGDFSTLQTSKRKRCMSCKELIDINAICVEFKRGHYPDEGVELEIYAEDYIIDNASHYQCEECGGIFFNFKELNFCVDPYESMVETIKEYKHDWQNPELLK